MSITYQQIATLAYRILHERGADEVWTYESPWERDFVVAVHVKGERKEGRLSSLEMDSRDDAARRMERELADLVATAELLGLNIREEDKAAKREKLKAYMDYARQIGTLT